MSLHPGAYRIAYTKEHWTTGEVPNNAPGPGRQVMVYEPSEVTDGVEYAWRLCFQCSALLDAAPLADEVISISAPDGEHMVQVDVWIVEPGVLKRPRHPLLPSPLPLAEGRRVWVGHDAYRAESAARHDTARRDYPAAMVEFLDRMRPDDAPGLALRPVDIA